MHPKDLAIADFTYDLADEKIAKYPLPNRDESRLLVYKNGSFSEDVYLNVDTHIPAESLLVFNNTKVLEARLLFTKSTGSIIELFCLEPAQCYADLTSAMSRENRVYWKCLVGGAKKWKEEPLVKLVAAGKKIIELTAVKMEENKDFFLIEFSWDENISFTEILHLTGCIPLPPYLNRAAETSDAERYQTIYALHDGSVAAPTAGLHFTDRIFEKLAAKKIVRDFVTLHVGAGTFKPVKAGTMRLHEMHAEYIEVTKELVENLLKHVTGNIVAVGTTSLRTLESLYWIGAKINSQPSINMDELHVTQWEPYQKTTETITASLALYRLFEWMDENQYERLITKTQIIIAPGYDLKIAKGLITNFHQPKSTLLLLVAAIIGDDWKKMYTYALENNFRFLSYGDGCLIIKPGSFNDIDNLPPKE